MGKKRKMKENQQVAGSKLEKRSTSSHDVLLNYGTLLLQAVDARSSCHLAAGKLSWELSLHPSLQEHSASSQSSQTPHRSLTILSGKRAWPCHLTVSHFKHQVAHCRQRLTALFTTTDSVISFLPLSQCFSGKMLLMSFDGNSTTQVK